MRCGLCQHENPPGAKFCVECASPLARGCPGCGSEAPPTAKFCPECATSLTARPQAPASEPRTYTPKHLADKILTALAAAAALIERCGARTLAPALREWRAELAAVLGDHVTSGQLLRQAEQGYQEIGATGRAERLARESAREGR